MESPSISLPHSDLLHWSAGTSCAKVGTDRPAPCEAHTRKVGKGTQTHTAQRRALRVKLSDLGN